MRPFDRLSDRTRFFGWSTMSSLSRFQFVPATTAVVLTILSARGAFAQPAQHVGTEAIAHTTARDAGVVMMHLQQQLVRVTGVATPRDTDVETLGRALEAARTRKVAPERMKELTEALATVLGGGVYEEVTEQRLAEDLFALLNNKALTSEQASLVAIDVGAVLQDLGITEPQAALVLTALRGVCPSAVAPQPTNETDASGQPKTAPKRSLLILSRDSN
jgi:hypothetical protein